VSRRRLAAIAALCCLVAGGCWQPGVRPSGAASPDAGITTSIPSPAISPVPSTGTAPIPSETAAGGEDDLVVEVFDDPATFGRPGFDVARVATAVGDGFVVIGDHSETPGSLTHEAWLTPDGRTWERVGDIRAMGAATVTGVAELASGRLVAVGSEGPAAKAWLSDDAGRTWRDAPAPTDVAGVMLRIIVAGPRQALVMGSLGTSDGSPASVLFLTSNGEDWTSVDLPAATFSGGAINDIAPLGDGFVAVGGRTLDGLPAVPGPTDIYQGLRRAAWHSADGLTWATAAIDADSGEAAPGPMGKMLAGSARLLAFGLGPATSPTDRMFYASSDGASWAPGIQFDTSNTGIATWNGQIYLLRSRFVGSQPTAELIVGDGLEFGSKGSSVDPVIGGGWAVAGAPGILQPGIVGDDVRIVLVHPAGN
jgi:hypothetical protein